MGMQESQGNWKSLKGKIKSKFSKLTDYDLESLNGQMDRLQGKVQKAYDYSKDKAEKECNSFNQSLKS